MGLTSNQSSTFLLKSLDEFRSEVKSAFERINDRLDALEVLAFEADILQKEDDSWETIRLKRNYLLKSTDWVMIPGSTLDQVAWAEYRQFLRDLPQTYAGHSIDKVIWPVMPAFSGPNTTQVE